MTIVRTISERMSRMHKPNVLLITADSLRRDALGCYGNNTVKTPNLDRLSSDGVRFTHAYTVCPLCMPSRHSIATGRYVHQHGVVGNMCGPLEGKYRKTTFAAYLKKVGYQTAFIGRHHFIDYWGKKNADYTGDRELEFLQSFGFDNWVQAADEVSTQGIVIEDHVKYLKSKGILRRYLEDFSFEPGPMKSIVQEDHVDEFIKRNAIEQMDRFFEDEPFLMWVSFTQPHPPYRAVGAYGHVYDQEDMPEPSFVQDKDLIERTRKCYAQYYGKVQHVDHCVGEILETLDKRNMLHNTYVVFTTDHGDMLGERGIYDKRFLYESSVSIPLLMRGPGVLSGVQCKTLSENVDIHATILDIAGVRHDETFPGTSLLRQIGRERSAIRSAAFSEIGTWLMVRTANWKLTFDPEQGGVQTLYNIADDPQESKNVANQPAFSHIEKELVEQLFSWFVSTTTWTHDKEYQRLKRILVRP